MPARAAQYWNSPSPMPSPSPLPYTNSSDSSQNFIVAAYALILLLLLLVALLTCCARCAALAPPLRLTPAAKGSGIAAALLALLLLARGATTIALGTDPLYPALTQGGSAALTANYHVFALDAALVALTPLLAGLLALCSLPAAACCRSPCTATALRVLLALAGLAQGALLASYDPVLGNLYSVPHGYDAGVSFGYAQAAPSAYLWMCFGRDAPPLNPFGLLTDNPIPCAQYCTLALPEGASLTYSMPLFASAVMGLGFASLALLLLGCALALCGGCRGASGEPCKPIDVAMEALFACGGALVLAATPSRLAAQSARFCSVDTLSEQPHSSAAAERYYVLDGLVIAGLLLALLGHTAGYLYTCCAPALRRGLGTRGPDELRESLLVVEMGGAPSAAAQQQQQQPSYYPVVLPQQQPPPPPPPPLPQAQAAAPKALPGAAFERLAPPPAAMPAKQLPIRSSPSSAAQAPAPRPTFMPTGSSAAPPPPPPPPPPPLPAQAPPPLVRAQPAAAPASGGAAKKLPGEEEQQQPFAEPARPVPAFRKAFRQPAAPAAPAAPAPSSPAAEDAALPASPAAPSPAAAAALVQTLTTEQFEVLLEAGCIDEECLPRAPRVLLTAEREAFSAALLEQLAGAGVILPLPPAAAYVLGSLSPQQREALQAAGCADSEGRAQCARLLTREERRGFEPAVLQRLAELGVVLRPSPAGELVLGLPQAQFDALLGAGCVGAAGEPAAPRALSKAERAALSPALLALLTACGVLPRPAARAAASAPAASALVQALTTEQYEVLLEAGCIDEDCALHTPRALLSAEREAFTSALLEQLAGAGVILPLPPAAAYILGSLSPQQREALQAAGCADSEGRTQCARLLTREERGAFEGSPGALQRLAELGVVLRPSPTAELVLGLSQAQFDVLLGAGCVGAAGEPAAPRALVKAERAAFTPALLAQLISKGVLLKAGAATA